mmetsp:Transcript_71018/g.196101  ORF Transcript_71018/g.196101 Transcript_71018/m.196101 type:complete len:546 (+) Transcript_71018:117-1754(+)
MVHRISWTGTALRGSLLALCARTVVVGALGAPEAPECEAAPSRPSRVLLQQQLQRGLETDVGATKSLAGTPQACVKLEKTPDLGAFHVDVEVGTPGQGFRLIADTGSNTVVVASCLCQRNGYCSRLDRCFMGTGRSSSFAILQDARGVRGVAILYGSGPIEGVLAREIVRLAGLEVDMKDGILLMTSQHLDFVDSGNPFEGILGLGIPMEQQPAVEPPGLLEQAHIGTFAMCLNEDGHGGVLRLGLPELPGATWHASVSREHWALDFRGTSVAGSELVHVDACSPKDMGDHQRAACQAIVDSGSTLIFGPSEQLAVLVGSICDGWPRCRQNHTAIVEAAAAELLGFDPFPLVEPWIKVAVLEALLEDCEDWLDKADGLEELPTLLFRVAGAAGEEETLIMPGRAYVIEAPSGLKGSLTRYLEGHGNASSVLASITGDWLKHTGRRHKVCMHAFDRVPFDVPGVSGWILGQPFFYEYSVAHDLSVKPPVLSFQSAKESPCGSCDRRTGLVSLDAATSASAAAARLRRPRWLEGRLRGPSLALRRPV